MPGTPVGESASELQKCYSILRPLVWNDAVHRMMDLNETASLSFGRASVSGYLSV